MQLTFLVFTHMNLSEEKTVEINIGRNVNNWTIQRQ